MTRLHLWSLLSFLVASADESCFLQYQQQQRQQQQQQLQLDDEFACLQLNVQSVSRTQEKVLNEEPDPAGSRFVVGDYRQVNDSAHRKSEEENGTVGDEVNITGEKHASKHVTANGTVFVNKTAKNRTVDKNVNSTGEKHVSKHVTVNGSIRKEGKHGSDGTGDNITSTTVPLNASEKLNKETKEISDSVQDAVQDVRESIAESEVRRLEDEHVVAKKLVVPLALAAFVIFIVATVMERYHVEIIPEAAVMILVGVVLGLFITKGGRYSLFSTDAMFDERICTLLMMAFLPIIIFASGWTLRRQDFLSQFPYILLFAIVGVVLSMLVIAFFTFWTGSLGFHNVKSIRTAFAYATLLSATDPVSCLVVYSKLKVDPLLNILVYGEATINDAVAIVLFHVFNRDKYMDGHDGNVALLANMAHGLVVIFCGSSGIGFLSACICTFIARWTRLESNKKYTILVITAACYLTYGVAECFGMSGIIANLFFGIFSGVYMRPVLSQEGSLMATFFLNQLAMLADAGVFVLVGFCVVELTTKEFQFSLWMMLFCLIGRLLSVFPVAWLVNVLKEIRGQASDFPRSGWHLLSVEQTFMIWHAGLRGGIALVLSLQLGRWVDRLDGPGTVKTLQTATFTLVCVFLVLFGGTTAPCLRILGIALGKEYPPDALSVTEGNDLRDMCLWVDEHILRPLLLGRLGHHAENPEDVEQVLKNTKDRLSSSAPNLSLWRELHENQDQPGPSSSRLATSGTFPY